MKSIRTRILLLWFQILFAVAVVIISISSLSTYKLSLDAARETAQASALKLEREIKVELEQGLNAARTLAYTLEIQVDPESDVRLTRNEVSSIIRQLVLRTPVVFGSCTQWMPDAFDGRDAEFINRAMHDSTGMFIPYWYRKNEGGVAGEPLRGYSDGEWWVLPRSSHRESVIEPYIYPLEEGGVAMITFSVPILYNDTFYGVGTVDIKIDFIQQLVDNFTLFTPEAAVTVISHGGKKIASNRCKPSPKSIEEIDPHLKEILDRAGDKDLTIEESEGSLIIISPLSLGESGTPWFVVLEVPMATITAPAKSLILRQLGIWGLCIVVGLLLLWGLIGRITKPIVQAAALADEIKSGDLTQRLNIERDDEIGQLGAALDAMTHSLQKRTTELTESRINLEKYQNHLEQLVEEQTEDLKKISNEQQIILSNIGVGVVFLVEGKVVWSNSEFAAIIGCDEPEIPVGTEAYVVYKDEEDYLGFFNEIHEQLSRGESTVRERIFFRNDRTEFWGRICGKSIDSSDLSRGSIWILEDITEQKKYEENLLKNQTLLNESQRLAHMGSWELNLNDRTLVWSDEAYQIYGYEKGTVSPDLQTFIDLLPPDDRRTALENFEAMLKSGIFEDFEAHIITPSGEKKVILVAGEIV